MGKKSDLSPECQKFVKKLFAFFSKEKATKKPIVSFDRVYERTSKALGVSYTSVHRIMNGKRPCKSNRPKERAKILDDFDHCVISSPDPKGHVSFCHHFVSVVVCKLFILSSSSLKPLN